MKSRKLGIALLLLLSLVVTTGTFAYWASTVNGSTDNQVATITIGQGGTANTTLTLTNDSDTAGDFVPTAYVESGVTTDTKVLTLPVAWAEDTTTSATGAAGTLEVLINSVTVGGADVTSMFTATVTSGDGAAISLDGSAVNVVITVVFGTEPADQATYDAIANGTLNIDVTVNVTAN